MSDRLAISPALHMQMVEVARELRRESTPSEEVLWHMLRGRRLDGIKFRRQQPIGPFVVDFFCPQHALIVEVDGPIHDTQVERDRERQALLEACGYRVLRLAAHEVEHDCAQVIVQIRQALAARPPSPAEEHNAEHNPPLSRRSRERGRG